MKFNLVGAAGLLTLGLAAGCGGSGNTAVTTVPTAHLTVAPASMTAETGTPVTVTVTALDTSNAVVPTYVGTVHITTSDTSATLPHDATLSRGTGQFAVIFGTAGSHTITASDTAGNAIAATSGSITVSIGVSAGTGPITVIPTSLILPARGVQQFGFSATGTDTFTWSVEEDAAGGSISATGLYTAPASPGTYHVIVTASTSSDTGSATVSVIDPAIASRPTGSMQSAHGAFTETLLADGPAATNGKVLIAGGNSEIPSGMPVRGVSSAELYDPSAGSFAATGSMISPRYAHTATLLPDGTVLMVGGLGDGGNPGPGTASPPVLASAEIYSPATGTFAKTGNLLVPRANHTATLLSGGRVLIVGGIQENTDPVNNGGSYPYFGNVGLVTAELYDVATGVFTATGSMSTGRFGHTATLLADGTVLVTGGERNSDWFYGEGRNTVTAEVYDPVKGTFSAVGDMRLARTLHAATLLSDGKVLITGGTSHSAPAELYDPKARAFSNTGSMRSVRNAHTATKLANGSVLVAGGALWPECIEDEASYCQPVTSLEIFEPTTGTFAPIGFMNAARWAHTATLLDSGEVLLTGGEEDATAELYP